MDPSLPFSYTHDLPNSSMPCYAENRQTNSNTKLTSIVTFSSRPLQKNKEQQVLARAKRRRQQRALRMSRETQIPALTLHCESQFNSASCFKGSPNCLSTHKGSNQNMGIDLSAFGKVCPSMLSSSPGGAIVVYDGRVFNNRMFKTNRSFSDCSGGDGDVSDVSSDRGPDLFEFRNWQCCSSSSPSSSIYESPLNVSKAMSDCSCEGLLNVSRAATSTDSSNQSPKYGNVPRLRVENKIGDREDTLSAEYWKLQADVLAAECKLLRVEKELTIRRWNRNCVSDAVPYPVNATLEPAFKEAQIIDSAFTDALYSRNGTSQRYPHETQAKEVLEDASKKLFDMSYSSKYFTQEALRKLEEISLTGSRRRVPIKDPTEALQKRLQGLLRAARPSALEPGIQMYSSSYSRSHDAWEYADPSGNSSSSAKAMANSRCFAETAASKKQLDVMSLEFSETKDDAAAYIRREYRSMPSEGKTLPTERGADQSSGEEAYCKAAIRQIVAQVQAENEQWSQVQHILCSLQEEMEILMETRDLAEKRAARAEAQLLSLKKMVHDWRCRARSAEEEVVVLQSEREALNLRIQHLKQKHAYERRSWFEDGSAPREAASLSQTDTLPSVLSIGDVEEQPRLANVGTQEDYALCESIVHSRNASSRSSVDLGITTQSRIPRSIKKSLDFSNSSNEGNTSKSRVRSHRKIEPTRLDFCSKTSDVSTGARHKISWPQSKVELTRLECVEPVCTTEYKERKKARLFAFKENCSMSGPIETHSPLSVEPVMQRSSLGHLMSATQDLLDHAILSKSKSPLPSAPTSTPSRLPFGEIFNSPSSR
ncbi:hypothetical protein L7F22_046687 [Adiantum nelumboides]|nr:hypothetical protein [Adiantum nelumboides]